MRETHTHGNDAGFENKPGNKFGTILHENKKTKMKNKTNRYTHVDTTNER